MQILFILPYDNTYHYKGNFSKAISYAPLTLTVLAALVPDRINAEIKIVDEGVQNPCLEGDFDVVAISCVTSSANRAYDLCSYWRQKGSYVILGGVHVTLQPEEAAQHADSIFIGPAEQTFPAFWRDYENGSPQKIYRHTAGSRDLSMPLPRRDLLSKAYMNIPTLIANRGCMNGCTYCTIPRLWGGREFARPVGEVVEEIKTLGPKRMILLDPSLTADEEYAAELFRALQPLKKKWSGLCTLDVVHNPTLFQLMVDSGCEGILTGFESICSESLFSVNKSSNKVDDYRYTVRQFHDAGIPVLGCFVTGFDGDTKESLLETINIIDEIEVDLPRFSILTPFPGTPLFAKHEQQGRILTHDWRFYDTMHVVYQPKNMLPDELTAIFHQMWKNAYTVRRIAKRFGNTRKEKIIQLSANLGFKYYAYRLRKEHLNHTI